MELLTALKLSAKKWDWIVKNNGEPTKFINDKKDNGENFKCTVSDQIPELKNLKYNCGMCEYTKQQLVVKGHAFDAFTDSCRECLLYKNNSCGEDNSLYDLWEYASDEVSSDENTFLLIKYAQELLDSINELIKKEEESRINTEYEAKSQ